MKSVRRIARFNVPVVYWYLLLFVVIGLLSGARPTLANPSDDAGVGNGTPESCTGAAIDNAFSIVSPRGMITFDCGGASATGVWFDDFDSYATGQNLHSVGGWKGFLNKPAYTAHTTSVQARSALNSVDIAGSSDLVHEYDATTGLWIFTTWQYLPGNFQGVSYFIMLNEYDDDNDPFNVSVQVHFDSTTGLMYDVLGTSMPFVTDQWSKIQVVIDLDDNTQAFYYNNSLLYSGTWSEHVSGGGSAAIRAVNLHANGANSAYYDDMSLQPGTTSGTVGTGTPGSCTEAYFESMLAAVQISGGGTINFDCGGAATITFTAEKNITTNVTIDGGNNITLDGGNASRFFVVAGGAMLNLENITLRNGFNDTLGGGAIVNSGTLTLDGVTVRDSNVDPSYSGGAILSYGPVTMDNSLIENNTGGSVGGLFLVGETAVATITNSTLRNNRTTNPDYGLGGAITLWNGADVTLLNSVADSNTAVDGAALYNASTGGEMYIREGSVLRDNEASRFGGAIFSNAGLVKIEGSTVADNVAASAGGAISNQQFSDLIAIDTTFTGNSVPTGDFSTGGAIDNASGDVTLANVTLSQNSADNGGGLANSGEADLTHVTFSNNSAINGAGILNDDNGYLTLKNVLLNHGTGGANCDDAALSTTVSLGFNLSSDDSCELNQASDQKNIDPLLGSLADNGGATLTHMLLADSPAIDTGICVDILLADQREVTRPQGDGCDIGAVEVQPSDGTTESAVYLPAIIK